MLCAHDQEKQGQGPELSPDFLSPGLAYILGSLLGGLGKMNPAPFSSCPLCVVHSISRASSSCLSTTHCTSGHDPTGEPGRDPTLGISHCS